MKLKVQKMDTIYGSYVHSALVPSFHRRTYWLFEVMFLNFFLDLLDSGAVAYGSVRYNQVVTDVHDSKPIGGKDTASTIR